MLYTMRIDFIASTGVGIIPSTDYGFLNGLHSLIMENEQPQTLSCPGHPLRIEIEMPSLR